MGGVSGGRKILPRFPRLWGAWGRGAVFESCLVGFTFGNELKTRCSGGAQVSKMLLYI